MKILFQGIQGICCLSRPYFSFDPAHCLFWNPYKPHKIPRTAASAISLPSSNQPHTNSFQLDLCQRGRHEELPRNNQRIYGETLVSTRAFWAFPSSSQGTSAIAIAAFAELHFLANLLDRFCCFSYSIHSYIHLGYLLFCKLYCLMPGNGRGARGVSIPPKGKAKTFFRLISFLGKKNWKKICIHYGFWLNFN